MKTRWYKDAVIYQIYPRSFCDSNGDGIGDINGIISKLDYLADLGINAVWLSPCYSSPNDDNGYDISNYRDIMKDFGTLDDWKLMVREMHARGIKLIMDLVVNHSSDEHKWFQESRKSLDNPYRDYYIWRKGKGKDGNRPPNNWQSNFLGSAWTKDDLTGEYYLHLFSQKQPDLNWDNPKVRQEVIDICNYWFELGVDGFRCDVITYIAKDPALPDGKKFSFPRGREHYVLAEKWDDYIRDVNKMSWSQHDSLIVGECALIKYDDSVKISDEGNNLLDMSFSFEASSCDALKFSLPKLKKIYAKYQNVPKSCWTSNFIENHDQPRSLPRFTKTLNYRERAAAMLATMIMFQRGTPYIYQGQEIGMTNCDFKPDDYMDIMSLNILKTLKKFGTPMYKFGEKILRKWARDNARTPMQWDDSANAGFTNGTPWMCVNPNYKDINVLKDKQAQFSVIEHYKAAIKLRHMMIDIIADGQYTDLSPTNKKLYQYCHKLGNKTLLVQLNFTDKHISLASYPDSIRSCQLLLDNYSTALTDSLPTSLKPFEAAVYLLKD